MYGATDPSWRSGRSLLGLADVRRAHGRFDEAQAAAERAAALREQTPSARG
jgi:hypothetical protein